MECIYFSDPPIHNAEDVDEDEEQSYEERHPPRHNFRRDEEADPGHHHEQPRREVVERDVLELVAGEEELEAGGGEVEDPWDRFNRNNKLFVLSFCLSCHL